MMKAGWQLSVICLTRRFVIKSDDLEFYFHAFYSANENAEEKLINDFYLAFVGVISFNEEDTSAIQRIARA